MGIVDPGWTISTWRACEPETTPEGWDVQPTHPELLEALADDFISSGYDLQHLHKTIAKSATYQLSSGFPPASGKPSMRKYFARKFIRRLSAEQVYDSIVKDDEPQEPDPDPSARRAGRLSRADAGAGRHPRDQIPRRSLQEGPAISSSSRSARPTANSTSRPAGARSFRRR